MVFQMNSSSMVVSGAGRRWKLCFLLLGRGVGMRQEIYHTPPLYQQRRLYAKGRDKAKKSSKKLSGGGYVDKSFIPKDVLDVERVESELDEEVGFFKESFASQVSLRIDLRAYEQLQVPFGDGSVRTLEQLGTIRRKANFLEVVLTLPEYQKPVKLAIEKSALNVNPQTEQNTIIIPLPRATREHREQLVKLADVSLHRFQDRLNAIYSKHRKQIDAQMMVGSAARDNYFQASQLVLQMKNVAVQRAKEFTTQKKKELMEETL